MVFVVGSLIAVATGSYSPRSWHHGVGWGFEVAPRGEAEHYVRSRGIPRRIRYVSSGSHPCREATDRAPATLASNLTPHCKRAESSSREESSVGGTGTDRRSGVRSTRSERGAGYEGSKAERERETESAREEGRAKQDRGRQEREGRVVG